MKEQNPDKHKQSVKHIFDLVASNYDNPAQRYFPMCGDRLATNLKPRPGSRVLDIATGTGAVATAIAQGILPGGRVQAIDLSDNMLDKAFENFTRQGLSNIDLHNMDAGKLDFKSGYFDYISCGFGILFLPDIPAALQEWLRVLKPQGKLMFTTFTAQAFQPLLAILLEQLANYGIDTSFDETSRLMHVEHCTSVLEQSGFEHIHVHEEQHGFHLSSENDWWEIVMSSGLRGLVEQLNTVQQAQLRLDLLNQAHQLATDKGIWMDVSVLFSSGSKPSA